MSKKIVIILRKITFISPILFVFLTGDIVYVMDKKKDYWSFSLLFVTVALVVFVIGVFSLKKYKEEKEGRVLAIIGMVIMLYLLVAVVYIEFGGHHTEPGETAIGVWAGDTHLGVIGRGDRLPSRGPPTAGKRAGIFSLWLFYWFARRCE